MTDKYQDRGGTVLGRHIEPIDALTPDAARELDGFAIGWKPIEEHPPVKFTEQPPHVILWGIDLGRHMGQVYVYHFAEGGRSVRAVSPGFHGDWKWTKYHELPPEPIVSRARERKKGVP